MAENQTPALEDAPHDLYPASDLRFVLVEIGKLGAKVDRLVGDVEKIDERISHIGTDMAKLKQNVSFVKGAVWAIGVLGVLVGIAAGWYMTGKITISAHPGA